MRRSGSTRSLTKTASLSWVFSARPFIDADAAETPRDGKITGFAKIAGRDVGVVVNEFTTKGASTSATNSKKMGYIRKVCTERGMPFVHVGESTGARLPDAMGSKGMGNLLGNDITQFRRMRETPWAGGGARYFVRFVGMAVLLRRLRRNEERLDHVSVEPAPGVDGDRRKGRFGRARRLAAARRTDRAHRSVRRYRRRGYGDAAPLPVLHAEPQRRIATDRCRSSEGSGEAQERMLDILPEKRTQVYNMKKIVDVIFDRDSFFEIKPRFGRPAIVGLARLAGHSVGIIANNPAVGGGALSADACRKCIDFTVLCDSFNIPLVRIMDTPGFRRRARCRAAWRARPDHEFHERDLPDHRAADHCHRAQGLWPRLCRNGRRRTQ